MPFTGPDFRLRKWYLDCVSDDGVAFIGYAGRVRLGLLPLSYQATLLTDATGRTTQDFSLLPAALPARAERGVAWRNRRLSVSGVWAPVSAATPRVLLDEDGLRVTWRCHVPSGPVRLAYRGREHAGSGYAEELTLSGPPGRLPIEELHWGRFASGEHHLVWIEWRGPRPLRLILASGRFLSEGRIDERGVECETARLTLGESRPIRADAVADSLFGRWRSLTRLLPEGVGGWREEKWVSRARLETTAGEITSGWAIHERVRMR